jgi:hypothetical protein
MTEAETKAAERAKEARKQVVLLPPGRVRDALLEKIKQYDAVVPEEDQPLAIHQR